MKHYHFIRERDCKLAKEKKFVCSFALTDLNTRMYGRGVVSVRSGMGAYHIALDAIGKMRLDMKRVRLDEHYSYQEHPRGP